MRAKPGRRRRVDEAAFLERFDALRDHAVGHLDALALVERAQPLDQLLLPHLFVELALDQHARDGAACRPRPSRASRRRAWREAPPGRLPRARSWSTCESGSALPSATSFAIRRLPSSTASRISAEFWVESCAHLLDDRLRALLEVDHGIDQLLDGVGADGRAVAGLHRRFLHLVADLGQRLERFRYAFLHGFQRLRSTRAARTCR